MKTRRNTRIVTVRRRRVKQSNTRINHKKRTFSVRKRNFFKKGGVGGTGLSYNRLNHSTWNGAGKLPVLEFEPPENHDDIVPRLTEIMDGIDINNIVVELRNNGYIEQNEKPTISLTVKKMTETTNVSKENTPVSFMINNKKIDFYIVTPSFGVSERFVYIYVNGTLYGCITLVISGNILNSPYHSSVANAIKSSLIRMKQ